MTYTQTQLSIIRVFGRKELTEGCKFFSLGGNIGTIISANERQVNVFLNDYFVSLLHSEVEILGHIPHLEDVFRVAMEKGIYVSVSFEITRIYKEMGCEPIEIVLNPTLHLIDQPEETLTQLLSLFKYESNN